MVRPWKAPAAATMCGRPVRRAILNAASLASAPELQKNTRPRRRPASSSTSRSASAICGAAAKKLETWPSVVSCVGDGLHDRGCAWPSALTAMPAEQVEVARVPSASQT